MSKQEQTISPVSIDLGAENTGVYFTHYKAGANPDGVGKKAKGKVYRLSKDGYTLLMANRTAARHQRRGYDRRQMAKRLFKLIWTKHFDLPWGEDVEKTVGFLMNRRGFSFLTEEYNGEVLNQFPQEVFDLLPDDAKKILKADGAQDGDNAIAAQIAELAENGPKELKKAVEAIEEVIKPIKNGLVVIGKAKKLADFCNAHLADTDGGGKKRKEEFKVSGWILREWRKDGLCVLEDRPLQAKQANIGDIIRNFDARQTRALAQSAQAFLEKHAKRKEKLEKEVWNFAKTFSLEKAQDVFGEPDKKEKWRKAHLHHLFFALQKTVAELEGGARYRLRYFEEIVAVLGERKHKHGYLKRFCGALHGGKYPKLDEKNLAVLLGHIGNLELKPLRKYFNSPAHKKGDLWCEKRLIKYADRWMFKEWRVGEKDKLKQEGGKGDYAKLRDLWKQHQGGIVDFWLATPPVFTIPPYQNNNNRRPPKCQSLLLSPDFLDENFKGWQNWLAVLRGCAGGYLDGYKAALQDVKSGAGNSYFVEDEKKIDGKHRINARSRRHLEARELQFLLDRVKAEDPLNLNEIYSRCKKLRQILSANGKSGAKAARDELQNALAKSALPEKLKAGQKENDNAVFEQNSFLFLVCEYYKQRQRARDGRIFIPPQYRQSDLRGYANTGRFDDKKRLLVYCNHKPRQKQRQMLFDLAGLLQTTSPALAEKMQRKVDEIDASHIEQWLGNVAAVEKTAEKAANAQKKRRGMLKVDIQSVYGLLFYNPPKDGKKHGKKEAAAILSKSKVKDAQKLYSLCEEANEKCLRIVCAAHGEAALAKWEAEKNRAKAVYLLAQIYNLVYKERRGFSSVCAVCSVDNAQRMLSGAEQEAKAQRLPAIATRLIDGAVKRMARIVGGAIAEEKWQDIEPSLKGGERVLVPVVIEANRFEFEPSLKALKGKRDKGEKRDPLTDKKGRIKEAGKGVCPYNGSAVADGDGDLDHIVPRSGAWGTLNDEANLVWASDDGNKNKKGDQIFNLSNLHVSYLQKQFGTANAGEIEGRIVAVLGDGEGDEFKFGVYRSFINLSPEEQLMFRHALFLPGNHPLRAKVIKAIGNRSRTFVNGTQRFFAESLANALHRKALAIGKADLLSFDYFEIQAWDNTRGQGIKDMREELTKHYRSDLGGYDKDGSPQKSYSHLLDAQIAFCMALDAHQQEGSLGVDMRGMGLWSRVDEEGEMAQDKSGKAHDAGLFNAVCVEPGDYEEELKRRKVYDVETHYRQSIEKAGGRAGNGKVVYKIHRDNLIAERFFPLLEVAGEIRYGFDKDNSADYDKKKFDVIKPLFLRETATGVWLVDKPKALSFLMSCGRDGASAAIKNLLATHGDKPDGLPQKGIENLPKILDGLAYQTIKKPVQGVLQTGNEAPKTVAEALATWEESIKEENFNVGSKNAKIILPAYMEWQKLRAQLEKLGEESADMPFENALKKCRVFYGHGEGGIKKHHKARKVFSLPVKAGYGITRLQRRAWTGKKTIQLASEESLARYDGGRPHTILSKNSIPVRHYGGLPASLLPSEKNPKPISAAVIEEHNKGGKAAAALVSGMVVYKEAGRSIVRVKAANLSGLSLPQTAANGWKGVLHKHPTSAERDKAREKSKTPNAWHVSDGEFQWFASPFVLVMDGIKGTASKKSRGEIVVKKDGEGYALEFVASAPFERFLK